MIMKTFKISIYLFVIIGSIIFQSCSPAYVPNVVYTPMLVEKGDAKINAYYGVAGADFQVAYAASDNIGIMVNTSFKDTRDQDSIGYYLKHSFAEIGVGYFSKVGDIGIASLYGGLGFGKINSKYNSAHLDWKVNANSVRLFIQPAIGIRTDFYEGSFCSRIVGLTLNIPNHNKMVIFVEPVITNKIGFKYGKFLVQTGLSIPVSTIDIGYDYLPFLFSVGLELNIGEVYKFK